MLNLNWKIFGKDYFHSLPICCKKVSDTSRIVIVGFPFGSPSRNEKLLVYFYHTSFATASLVIKINVNTSSRKIVYKEGRCNVFWSHSTDVNIIWRHRYRAVPNSSFLLIIFFLSVLFILTASVICRNRGSCLKVSMTSILKLVRFPSCFFRQCSLLYKRFF